MNADASPGSTPSLRGRIAVATATAAGWASRATGRGSGAMIGGLLALKIAPALIGELGSGLHTALITGTNGKSTTTRMLAAALRRSGRPVVTQVDGANMDAGIASALVANRGAELGALEVDELHVPHIADELEPDVLVLLNLSRDQLDRVGEINMIERRLRDAVDAHPGMTIVANCDDVLVSSAAYDGAHVIWVAAGAGWTGDAASCPRDGEPIEYRPDGSWRCTGGDLERPTPSWWLEGETLCGPAGFRADLHLALPGRANLGNAAQAVAAAVVMGIDPTEAAEAVGTVEEIAGRYKRVQVGEHSVRLLLAKNPAGWQEALSMIDPQAAGLVIAVNGQVPDGEDLSWLWDVRFEHFENAQVVAAGERSADLAVRLTYAGAQYVVEPDSLAAIGLCPPGRVDVLANYTAFRDLNVAIAKGRERVHE